MKLLDTRSVKLADWLLNKIDESGYQQALISTGYLYHRGWEVFDTLKGLDVRTVSSVKVDARTAALFSESGELEGNHNSKYTTRFQTEFIQHSKVFILTQSETDDNDIAIIGSSNLTGPGLGLGFRKNLELNYIITDLSEITELKKWFEDLWNESKEYKDCLRFSTCFLVLA